MESFVKGADRWTQQRLRKLQRNGHQAAVCAVPAMKQSSLLMGSCASCLKSI